MPDRPPSRCCRHPQRWADVRVLAEQLVVVDIFGFWQNSLKVVATEIMWGLYWLASIPFRRSADLVLTLATMSA